MVCCCGCQLFVVMSALHLALMRGKLACDRPAARGCSGSSIASWTNDAAEPRKREASEDDERRHNTDVTGTPAGPGHTARRDPPRSAS